MMRLVLLLFLLLAAPRLLAAEGYIDVTAPVSRKLKLFVSPTTALAGQVPPEVARELSELFGLDLSLGGRSRSHRPKAPGPVRTWY